MKHGLTCGGAAAAALIVLSAAALSFAVRGDSTDAGDAATPAGPHQLGGTDRFLTFVSTDKPVYRPGERLLVRAAILHSITHAPETGDGVSSVVEVTGPKGDTVATGMVNPQDAVVGFAWDIPTGTPGGEYTVKVTHPYSGHAPGERKFDVRAYRAPRLKSQIEFVRDGYGPGDTVMASVHVERAEGGIPAGRKVTAIARVDGVEVASADTVVDESGNASTQFKLPATIERGEGSLAFLIEDGGVLETASKTIPILLQAVDVSLYPEGGDLVAGLPNRVYLEAFTPSKKPADIAGVVLNRGGVEIAKFATAHEGRGRFSFTPLANESYALRIDQPAGIKTTCPLPAVKDAGVAIQAADDVVAAGHPIRLSVASTRPGMLRIVATSRGADLATSHVRFVADGPGASSGPPTAPVGRATDIVLKPEGDVDGVVTITVWDDAKNLPLAERLVFRKPAKAVKIDVTPDKSTYTPGETVRLTVTTTDAAGKPVPAMVGMTVTDDSVLEMIEKREQAPRLPVMALLEADVKDLADAHVYLDDANPKAPLATDLLLGTQGWRRFALVKPAEFLAAHGDAGRRALAVRVVTEREMWRRRGAIDRFGGGAEWFDADGAGPVPARRFNELKDIRDGEAPPPPAAAREPAPAAADAAVPADALDEAPEAEEQAADAPAGPPLAAGGVEAARGGKLEAAPAGDDELREALAKADERQAGRALFAEADQAAAGAPAPMRQDFVVVREFAHAARPDRKPDDRVDFAETLFWNAGVRTDSETGQATFAFATSDAVTSFRVFTDAFDGAGALGHSSSAVESVKPFYVEMKMPLEVTQGDVIDLRATLVNASNTALPAVNVTPSLPKSFQIAALAASPLEPGARVRQRYPITVGDEVGEFDLTFDAAGGAFTDRVTRKLVVRPRGFPVEFARGGLLGPDGTVIYDIEIPQDVVAGSVRSELALYPTPLASLTQAFEALIQSPSGCFEQTSSTTYPLIMAQQYFMSHQGVDPKLIERSRTLLDDGYTRLVGFECKTTKGFEWFGADPGHDALSAYGLLEFTDMALVRQVDPRVLKDTREFLLKSRDGKGGFKRETHTLHTWVADPECANGYNTWALLECGTDAATLAPEIAWTKANLANSKNSYAVALGANVLSLAGDAEAARSFMTKLAAKQDDAGMVDGATTSVIGSGGEALAIETTALATLAWLREPAFAGNVERAMNWLCEVCKAGRFGSTQSTILALRAIVTYDKLRATPKAPGQVQVIVDGKNMGSAVPFDEKSQGAIKLQDVAEMLSPGRHTISLRMAAGASMPFSIAVKYNTLRPLSAAECKASVETTLRDAKVREGALTEAVVTVTNKSADAIPTPIAIVGIPGGLEVRHDQLKELVKQQKIAAYEVIGREVVLYWRGMKGGERVEVPLSLTAAIGGTFTAPASRAYLYYTDEHKHWAAPLAVTVTPE